DIDREIYGEDHPETEKDMTILANVKNVRDLLQESAVALSVVGDFAGVCPEPATRLGRLAAHVGDDVGGDVAQFAVAVLGCLAQQIKGGGGVAALLAHEDADGLVDDAAGDHRLGELVLQL